jgi:hypothetical protein
MLSISMVVFLRYQSLHDGRVDERTEEEENEEVNKMGLASG